MHVLCHALVATPARQTRHAHGVDGVSDKCRPPSLPSEPFPRREVGIQALYFGHDHANDYAGEINGVRLAYG